MWAAFTAAGGSLDVEAGITPFIAAFQMQTPCAQ